MQLNIVPSDYWLHGAWALDVCLTFVVPRGAGCAWYLRDLFSVCSTAGVTQHYTNSVQQWNRAESNRAQGESDLAEISGRNGSAQFPSDIQRPLAQLLPKRRSALFRKCSRAFKFDRRPQVHAYLWNQEFCLIFKMRKKAIHYDNKLK